MNDGGMSGRRQGGNCGMDVCLLGGHVAALEGCGHQSDHTHIHTNTNTHAHTGGTASPEIQLLLLLCSGKT